MRLDHTEITEFHSQLCAETRDCIGYRVTVLDPSSTVDWAKMARNPDPEFSFAFEMTSSDRNVVPRRVTKNNGCSSPAFPLFQNEQFEPTVWLSWREEWRPLGQRQFQLVGAGWTFYWGAFTENKKEQLFRAEWDVPQERGRLAPQPHWHLDQNLLATIYPRAAEAQPFEEPGELEEIGRETGGLVELRPDPVLQMVSLAKIHLGMGGWWHTEYPECWQCAIQDRDDLVTWGLSTLRQAKREFIHIETDTPQIA